MATTMNNSRINHPEHNNNEPPAGQEIQKWKVYFNGSFRETHSRDRAGRALSLGKRFVWEGDVWHVPAAYVCRKGLVIDFCVQVPAERIRSFMDKWSLPAENNGFRLTDEQQMLIDADNPLFISMLPKVTANGKVLPCYRGTSVSWNPCFQEGNRPAAESVLGHYGLDPADGWVIWRYAFPWVTKHKPKLNALSVTLAQTPVAVPGSHFRASMPGTRITFTYPATGAQHTLTVLDFERRVMAHAPGVSANQDLPSHYTAMRYALSPELPDGALLVTDSVRSDQPRLKRTAPNKAHSSESTRAAAAGIIGMAVSPTAIIVGGDSQSKLYAACSALRFKPADDIEWRLVFYEKKRADVTVALL